MKNIEKSKASIPTDGFINKMVEEPRRKKCVGQSTDGALYKLSKIIGGKLPSVNPLFTQDKLHFIVLTSLNLKVYLLETKQCVTRIALDSSDITDIYLDEDDESVWVVHRSGKCEIYNWKTKQIVNRVDWQIPVAKVVKLVSKARAIVLSEKFGSSSLVDLNLHEKEWQAMPIFTNNQTSSSLFAISNSLSYFAFYGSRKHEHIITVGQLDENFNMVSLKSISRTRPILSLAVSNAGMVAAGSVSGVIDLYYDSDAIPRALKWHVDQVLALSFSLNDEYLMSGGKERVLVFWQLETGNVQFLPRLDGDIRSINVDLSNEFYSLSLRGDQILVLSALDLISRLQVAGTKAEFTKLPADPERERKRRKKISPADKVGDFTAEYYIHPKTGHLYFPLAGAQIQIYDPVNDEQIKVLSVANTIQTGKVRKELLIKDPQITGLCFSKDGNWMVTVDERETPGLDNLLSKNDKEINLKFWQYKEQSKEWHLVTRIASPHGVNNSIVDIVAAGQSYFNGNAFLTACHHGGIRLWRLRVEREPETNKPARLVWGVRKILASSALTTSSVSLAWSVDSSLILIGIESTIHVVDAQRFEVKYALPNMAESRVRQLAIAGTHLVVLSKTRLVSWDLLNNCQTWSIIVHSPTNGRRLLAVDEQSQRIALAANYFSKEFKVVAKLLVFNCNSPLPVHVENFSCGVGNVKVVPHSADFSVLDIRGRVTTLSLANTQTIAERPIETLETFYRRKLTFVGSAIEEEEGDELGVPNSGVVLNLHSFDKVFDGSEYNTNNLEVLFDRVLQVLSPSRR